MLFLIGALRAVVELVGLCLLGQGILHLIGGAGNPVYRFFAIVTSPSRDLVRAIVPAAVKDRLIPALTFLLLFFLWIGLAWVRKYI